MRNILKYKERYLLNKDVSCSFRKSHQKCYHCLKCSVSISTEDALKNIQICVMRFVEEHSIIKIT